MTQEQYNILIEESQPHKVFKRDWSAYGSIDFADTFLPNVGGYKCKAVYFYDGANLLNGLQKAPQKTLKLTSDNTLISLITSTYPKDVEASQKKQLAVPAKHELLTFIETDKNDNLEVFFKFGTAAKTYLETYFSKKQPQITVSALESKSYKMSKANFINHFDNTLSHDTVMRFVLKTIGVDVAQTYSYDFKERLITLLTNNDISEFIYANTTTIDGRPTPIIIHARLLDNTLDVKFLSPEQAASRSKLSFLKEATYYLLTNNATGWSLFDTHIDASFITQFAETLLLGGRPLNNDEYKQIYNEFIEAGFTESAPKQKTGQTEFDAVANKVLEQIGNPFYQGTSYCVNLIQTQDREVVFERQIKNTINNTPCEVILNIYFDANGRAVIKHELAPDYLKDKVKKWEEEAKRRGLEVDIEALRQQVISDFTALETERNFSQRFIQNIKATFSDKIGGYLEAIQATQKVAKHVWAEGTINKSTWFSKEEGHTLWPTYMNLPPVVGGATDGVIDEIVGIPMAIKGVYGIVTDEKQREAIKEIFTKEGFTQMLDGMKQEAIDVTKDDERLQHFTAQATVSVAATLTGLGIITKSDEFSEVLEQVTKRADDLPDPKFQRITDLVKKNKRTVADEAELKKLIDNVGNEALSDAAAELLDLAKIAKKQSKKFTWEEVKAFFKRGNDFNRRMIDADPPIYDFHEITVEQIVNGKMKKYRLDSYNEGIEIVSRKATDFDNIQIATFDRYLKELKNKYPEGTKITAPKYPELEGKVLAGKLKLEVPETNKISIRLNEFQELARKYGIEIIFRPE